MDAGWYVRVVAIPRPRWWEIWNPRGGARIDVMRFLHEQGQGDLRELRRRLKNPPVDFGPFEDEQRVHQFAEGLGLAGAVVQIVGPPIASSVR